MKNFVLPKPNLEEVKQGIIEFQKREYRDAMYRTARFLVEHFWGDFAKVTDGLGVLLLTWNQASYRYGSFDFNKLENCLHKNLQILEKCRKRNISDLNIRDSDIVKNLFESFKNALESSNNRKSPVATAKALHLISPAFFPLWDKEIARGYNLSYDKGPENKYLEFCFIMKDYSDSFSKEILDTEKTFLKLIDEYNYAKFTKHWI